MHELDTLHKPYSPPPCIFLHIPKTAGTSLVAEMRWHYGNSNYVSHADHDLGFDYSTWQHNFFQCAEIIERYHATPFISGHFGFSFCEQFMKGRYSFSFLRNPAERIISYYHFCAQREGKQFPPYRLAKEVSFDTFLDIANENDHWLKLLLWNHQTWSLAHGNYALNQNLINEFSEEKLLSMALKNAKQLSRIGFVETFNEDKTAILHDLGIKTVYVNSIINSTPIRPKSDDLSAETKRKIAKLTLLDDELYRLLFRRKQLKKKLSVHRKVQNSITRGYAMSLSCIKELMPHCKLKGLRSLVQKKRSTYLDLMTKVLCGSIYKDPSKMHEETCAYDEETRERGLDWPMLSHTMIGNKRLTNVRLLVESVLGNNILGDLIETGAWRGGASIMMRAVLYAYDVTDRKVYVADSFEGLPPPNVKDYPKDAGSVFHTYPELSVPLEEVKNNFSAYGLLDDQVIFVKGWFKDTLPGISANKFALIRLDGDMYESTMDSLINLYDKLSIGGYIIIDDYHLIQQCKEAVHDFCHSRGITPKFEEIDGVGVYWKKI